MKKKILFVSLAATLLACTSNSASGDAEGFVSSLESSDEKTQQIDKEYQDLQKEIEEEKAKVTGISYDKVRHDFGTIKPESDNTTMFTVTNTGTFPLVIESVTASCGCTTPKKPEKPILPGKSDVIEVHFKPRKEQLNEIIKTVTVVANTEPAVTTVEVRAFVQE